MSRNKKNQALSEELANRKAEKKSAKTIKSKPKVKVESITTEPKRRGRPKGSTNKVSTTTADSKKSTQKVVSDTKPKKQRRKRGMKPTVVKKKKVYGVIENIRSSNFEMDYLVGRKVKIVDETPYGYVGVVMHPGYEGVEMAFASDEIKIIGSHAKIKEFFE